MTKRGRLRRKYERAMRALEREIAPWKLPRIDEVATEEGIREVLRLRDRMREQARMETLEEAWKRIHGLR